MAVFVQHRECEAFPCSQLRGSFHITQHPPPPTPLCCWTPSHHHPPTWEPKRGRTEASGVGGKRKEREQRRKTERVKACRFPRALWVAQMKFTSGAAWSKSRWLSVGLCLDASLYNFKWHTAADHTNLHCTPTSPLQKDTYTLTQIKTHTLSPLWWAYLGVKRGLAWSASQSRWLHK